MMRFSSFFTAAALFVALSGATDVVSAQSGANSGQIAGQIVDTSGGAIAAAEVTVRNKETNYQRTVTTDQSGQYAVALVPLGTYEVTATAGGLASSVREVTVTLGSAIAANFTLGPQGVRESVNVSADSFNIEPARTSSRSILTELQIKNLPASGRRIRSLFLLEPSTQIEPECGGFAMMGQKGLFANINVDGGDYTNTHWCGHVEFSPTFSIEALEEFQVLRSTFSAEFGRSTGGIINMSTKSGSNTSQGTGYYLFRNDALTADDPFGRQHIGVGQQLGGSFGGAIRQDRTFFFIAPEFQRNTKPVQVLYTALDAQNLRSTAAGQALLAIAPEQKLGALSQSQSVVTRIDHRVSQNHTVMGRFDYIRNRVTNNVGGIILTQGLGADSITNRALTNQALVTNRNDVTGMLQLTSVLSDTRVNELRVQLVREFRPWDVNGTGPEVTVQNGGATVAIYGPQATGLSYGNIGYKFSDLRSQIVENFSIVSGSHTAKFGLDWNRINGRTTFNPGSNGIYTFTTLADYVARRPFQYQQFAGSGELDTTIQQIAVYAQDEWRVRPGLTFSPGFRYETALLPDYEPATQPQNRFPGATSIPDDKELIAPRLGLAWDIGNKGKTVLRAAGGLFYAAPYMPLFEQSILGNGGNPELSSRVILTNADPIANAFNSVGTNLPGAPLGNLPVFTPAQLNQVLAPGSRIAGQTVNFFDPGFRLPRATQVKVAVEREIGSGMIAALDFTNINTTRIARQRNLNLPAPVADATGRNVYSGAKPYPTYGFVNVTESSARSLYRGLTASFNVRRTGFAFDAYYTLAFSYSEDDTERGISGIVFDDVSNLESEHTYSNIDQRHQFAANGVFFLPGSFEISSSARFNSGRPFTALAGSGSAADLNRDGVLRDRPIVDGERLERNTFRNHGYADVSLRVQRRFGLPGQRGSVALSVEVFNLFNFDNVEIGGANMVYGPGTVVQNGVLVAQAPPANFGQVRNAAGAYLTNSTLRSTPFQAQLGLRFEF